MQGDASFVFASAQKLCKGMHLFFLQVHRSLHPHMRLSYVYHLMSAIVCFIFNYTLPLALPI